MGACTVRARLTACLAASWCLCAAPLAAAEDAVTLLYNERPPYIVRQPDGSAAGLTATIAANAFKAAGIPVRWREVPSNRQIVLIQENLGNDCAIGWFKNAEREKFAKFTMPLYRDMPTVLLANRDFAVPPRATLRTLLARDDVRVLVKDRYSYGRYIDDLLAALKPHLVITSNENTGMVAMIKARRADFMFVAEEEANYLVSQAGAQPGDFKLVRTSDMPQGELRHLMCSKRVGDDVLARINAAIAPK